MANRTVKDAHSVKGTNPQYLIEKITRSRIYESRYWKEQCFALTAELMVDKAMELRYIGGVYGGNIKPTPFLCLVLKMLQIQPEKDIVVEFISQQDCKYVRALGAVYMRLTGSSLDCYKYLEPLYLDYRKLRRMNKQGEYELVHMDEFIDEILREDRVCDVILPRIQKRHVLEEQGDLAGKENYLEDDMDDVQSSDDEDEAQPIKSKSSGRGGTPEKSSRDWDKPRRSPSPRYRRSRSRSPRRREREERHRSDRERDRQRDRDRERDRDRDRDRRQRDSERDKSSKRHRSSRHDDDERRHKSKKSKKDKDRDDKKSRGSGGQGDVQAEIDEANALRAQLGLPPLK